MSSDKAELRRAIKERLSRLSENDRRVESQVIVRNLIEELKGNPGPITVYSPFLDEPDLRPLITELLSQKIVICLPKVEGNHLIMKQIRSLSDIARNPVTTIPEPTNGKDIDEALIRTVIIPGRAFTRDGLRLGRGNGGYDRWLEEQSKRNPKTQSIGVCFECQIVQEIPTEPHDRRVNRVITSR